MYVPGRGGGDQESYSSIEATRTPKNIYIISSV